MRLLADEDLDARIVGLLRDSGHDVVEIRGERAGSADEAVLALVRRSDRVLVTRDKDFGELVVRHGQRSAGIVLVRYRHGDPRATAEAILQVIGAEGEALKESFVVIDNDRTRILPLPP